MLGGGFTTVGQVLQLQGGTQIMKSGDTIINKLKAAKTMHMDGMGGVIQDVFQGSNLNSLLQNPLGAINSLLQGQLSSAISALTGAGGLGSLVSSMSNLASAATSITNQASSLLGMGSNPAGLLRVIAHAETASMMLDNTALSLKTVLAPIKSGGVFLTEISQTIPPLAAQVIGGTVTQAAAIAQTDARNTQLTSIVTASNYALDTVEDNALLIATASAVPSALFAGPKELQEALELSILPAPRAEMQRAFEELMQPLWDAEAEQARMNTKVDEYLEPEEVVEVKPEIWSR